MIFEEDEGYYNDPVRRSTEGSARISPIVKGEGLPSAHQAMPGMNAAQVELLHDLRQGPEAYLKNLRTEQLESEEGEGSSTDTCKRAGASMGC